MGSSLSQKMLAFACVAPGSYAISLTRNQEKANKLLTFLALFIFLKSSTFSSFIREHHNFCNKGA